MSVRRTILETAAMSWVLADATKFGRIARHQVTGLDGFSGLITDAAPPAAIAAGIEEHGGQILVTTA